LGISPPLYLFVIAAAYRPAELPSPSFLVLAHKYMYFALGDMKIHLKRNEIDLFIGLSSLTHHTIQSRHHPLK
jgi:hypothetical protein